MDALEREANMKRLSTVAPLVALTSVPAGDMSLAESPAAQMPGDQAKIGGKLC